MKSTKQLLKQLINILAVTEKSESFIGYSRLQYTIYLLQITGIDDSFSFFYKQNELYSEELNNALIVAKQLNYIEEEQKLADWGGTYYTYKLSKRDLPLENNINENLIQYLAKIDAEMLDIITTATYFSNKYDNKNTWKKIMKTKSFYESLNKDPDEYFTQVKEKYKNLREFVKNENIPSQLPDIA